MLDAVGSAKTVSPEVIQYMNAMYRTCDVPRETRIAVATESDRFRFEYCLMPGRTRWEDSRISDTMTVAEYPYPVGKSRPLVARDGGGGNALIDRRVSDDESEFVVRYFTVEERERLFGFPVGYTTGVSKTSRNDLLGNSIVGGIIDHLLRDIYRTLLGLLRSGCIK